MLKGVLGGFGLCATKFKLTLLCIDREIFKEWRHEGQTYDARNNPAGLILEHTLAFTVR